MTSFLLLFWLLSSLISHVHAAAACTPKTVTSTCSRTVTRTTTQFKTATQKLTVTTTLPQRTSTRSITITSKQTITSTLPPKTFTRTNTHTIKGPTITQVSTVVRTSVSTSIKLVTLPQSTLTQTRTITLGVLTITRTNTVTMAATTITETKDGSIVTSTITLPGSTITIAGTTITSTITLPASTITSTITQPGSTITLPDKTITSTITLPGSTITLPGDPVTETVTVTTTGSASVGCPTGDIIINGGFEDSDSSAAPWRFEQTGELGPESGVALESNINHIYQLDVLESFAGNLLQDVFVCRNTDYTLRLWAIVTGACYLDLNLDNIVSFHRIDYDFNTGGVWKEFVFTANTRNSVFEMDRIRTLRLETRRAFNTNEPCYVAFDNISLRSA